LLRPVVSEGDVAIMRRLIMLKCMTVHLDVLRSLSSV
jgi:hypothetical protein